MGLASALSLPETDSVWTEALIAFGVDQVAKFAVMAALPLHGALNFLPAANGIGWLIIRHEENCAGGGGIPRFPTIVYLIVVIMAVPIAGRGRAGGGLLVGGCISNMSSFFIGPGSSVASSPLAVLLTPPTGCVVDFIQIGAPVLGSTVGTGAPVGNIADVLVIAASLMLTFDFFEEHKPLAIICAPFALCLLGLTLHIIRRIITGA
jgi:lipoprotein signal peptidase